MKKYYILSCLVLLWTIVYFCAKGSLAGSYHPGIFEYLDSSDQRLKFISGNVVVESTDSGGKKSTHIVGTFVKKSYGEYTFHMKGFGQTITLMPGILGLYISDNDAKNLNLRMPTAGNILFPRKL